MSRSTLNNPSTRRWVGAVALLVLVALLAGTLPAGIQALVREARPPRLIMDKSVGADFSAVAAEAWDQFVAAFGARRACLGDVRLRAAWELDSRAAYDPDTATVTVRVPGTPAMLRSALIHEWAHHLEFHCRAHEDMRAEFMAAQGLPPGTSWRPDTPPAQVPARLWAIIPSEQYAEAAIEVVLGGRPVPTNVRLTRDAVRVVRQWANGE